LKFLYLYNLYKMSGYIISDKNEINVEEHEIKSFDILHKTDLNIFVIENNKILYKNYIIYNASQYGNVQVLEWFKNSGYEFKYDEEVINYASENGHIQVLEWFKNSGYEFKYNENAINCASLNGHIQVLEWFKNSGYEFEYDNSVIDDASYNGDVQVLEWFKNSGYKFKYTKDAFYNASQIGNIQVLEWFKNSGYKFKYNKYAFKTNFINILKFYCNHVNIKKSIKWTGEIIFIKTIKFKANRKYLKGYQKN
jgi:hypothetical protein